MTQPSRRERIRSTPGLAQVWRVGVFVAGLLSIAVGLVLVVLPGPLTIPPVLFGLWIWSTEFTWARRFFVPFQVKAVAARSHARQHPLSSALVTAGGLVAAGFAIVVVRHFAVVDRVRDLAGI